MPQTSEEKGRLFRQRLAADPERLERYQETYRRGSERARGRRTRDKETVLRFLIVHGLPIYGDEASRSLGWTLEKWWAAVTWMEKDKWFEVTGKGYVVTGSGKRAADRLSG